MVTDLYSYKSTYTALVKFYEISHYDRRLVLQKAWREAGSQGRWSLAVMTSRSVPGEL